MEQCFNKKPEKRDKEGTTRSRKQKAKKQKNWCNENYTNYFFPKKKNFLHYKHI